MSVYSVKGRGWRYDFTLEGTRHTKGWFKTKKAAQKAEIERREAILNPPAPIPAEKTPTDMAFLDLVNRRLDYVQAYNSESHYRDTKYHGNRWVRQWNGLMSGDITTEMVELFLKNRLEVSPVVANKELQYLRAMFNFGIKKGFIIANPTAGIEFFPIERRRKYIPPKDDLLKVLSVADPEAQQYLWVIISTAGRVGEINALTWDDVDFDRKLVTLWTRKRKGGNREPRDVPMIQKLYDILKFRSDARKDDLPWVFWHSYWSRKTGRWVKGPYGERKVLMKRLCDTAGVRYFRYHALRHLTASMLDGLGIPIGVIQRILGHQNRRTTEIYLHTVGEAERAAMAKLESTPVFQVDLKPDLAAPVNQHLAFWHRKVKQRPSYRVLRGEVERLGYSGTGKKYGVSDNAIRKWMKAYEDAPNPAA
jgi:integrase